MKSKILKKIMSYLLSILCVLSLLPISAVFAEEIELDGWNGYEGYYELGSSGLTLYDNDSNNFVMSDTSATSFILEADVNITSSVGGFVFGASSKDGSALGREWYGVHIGNGKVRLFYEASYWDSSLPKLDVSKTISNLGTNNKVKVEVIQNNINIYVNGLKEISTSYDNYTGGYVGFCNYNTESNYKNITFVKNDIGNWKATNNSNFTVEEDKVIVNKLNNANNFILSDVSAKSFTMEADVKLVEGTVTGFLFGCANSNPGSLGADWYSLQVESDKDIRLFYEKNHGALNKYVRVDSMNLSNVHLKLVVDGTNFKVYVDNSEQPIMNETVASYAGGYIGLCSWNAKGEISNIKFNNTTPITLSNFKGFDGKYSVGDSEAIVLKNNNGNNYLVSDTKGTDFTLEAMVDTSAGGVGGFLFAAAQSSPSGLGNKWNAVHLQANQVRLFCESTWNKDGGLNEYASYTNNGGKNKLKLEVKGTTFKVYVNDELKITATQDVYEGGYVGFCNYRTITKYTDVYFSNDEPTGFLTNLGTLDTWTVKGGSWSEPLRGYRESSTAGGDFFSISDTFIPAGSSFVIEADVHIENANGGGGIVFVKDKNNPTATWYCANIDKPWQKGAKLFKNVSGTQTLYASKNFTDEQLAQKNYHIRVELLNGGHFNYYLNGVLIGSGVESSFAGGYVGLVTFAGSDVTFNKVYYYPVVDPVLTSLSIKENGNDVALNDAFDSAKVTYMAEVEDDCESVTVYPTPLEGMEVYVQSNKVEDLSSGYKVNVKVGYTNVDIKVKDPLSGVSKTYTVSIYRKPDQETIYDGDMRAQLHFSPQINWMNDPNGLVYNPYTKEYHLFYQYNPYGTSWGNMSWGHAISKDLVNWEELPVALFPDEYGTRWSGSAVIDYKNTTGFFDENTPPENRMVLIPMLNEVQGDGAGLAYSTDGGRTFVEYKNGDFVFKGRGDPKVVWYEDASYENGGIWLIVNTASGIYSSPDLKTWTKVGNFYHLDGKVYGWECQDFYPLEVLDKDGKPTGETKWVYNCAGSFYTVGRLVKDGNSFNYYAETEEIMYNGDSHQWNNSFFAQPGDHLVYATQTYFNDAKDRRVSISWLRENTGTTYDSTKGWNGYQSLAMETTLRKVDGKYVLYSYPVEEVEDQRSKVIFETANEVVSSNTNILKDVKASLYDIEAVVTLGENTEEVGFSLRGKDGKDVKVYYKVSDQKLYLDKSNSVGMRGINSYTMTPLKGNKVKFRIVVDNAVIEAFGNDGMAPITTCYTLIGGEDMGFYVKGDAVTVDEMTVWTMDSIWKDRAAVLNDLKVSSGTLDPVFSEAVFEYTVNVDNAVDSITITPTLRGNTVVSIDGESVSNESASAPIALEVGENKIEVIVTKDGGDPVVYTIYVYRAEPELALSSDVTEVEVNDSFTITPNIVIHTFDPWIFDEEMVEVTLNEDGSATFKALKSGTVTIGFISAEQQYKEITITVTEKEEVVDPAPGTGDTTNVVGLIAMLVMALLAMVTLKKRIR